VSLSDGVVIIDFEKNKSNLKKMIWISPLCAVVLMAWVLYRRDKIRRGIVDEDMFGV
jgi:cytochrome c-type biogenesis protein CcmH/NrfF